MGHRRALLFAPPAASNTPPAGYTGMVAPGYAPAGDPRLRDRVNEIDAAYVSFTPDWGLYGPNSAYAFNYLRATVSTGGLVTLGEYFGGGFYLRSYTTSSYGALNIYDNGVLVHTATAYTPTEQFDHRLKDANGNDLLFSLPVGRHVLTFVSTGSAPAWVWDCIEFAPLT